MAEKYFATLPTNEIGDKLLEKKDQYYQYLEDTGRTHLLHKSYEMYHRGALLSGEIERLGNQGEILSTSHNHYHNLCQHRLIMTTSQRIAFEPKAINTDSESQAQVILAAGLLEYYERVKKMERHLNKATDYAIKYGEGFVSTLWNPTKGEVIDSRPGQQPLYEGDLEFGAYHTFNCIRSTEETSQDDHSWMMLMYYRNRYDMAAKFPELAERILSYQVTESDKGWRNSFDYLNGRTAYKKYCEDKIPVYSFFHRKSESLPNGRLVEFTDSDIVYADGPIPYKSIPLFRIAPEEQEDCMLGYTVAFDLLPMQESLDKLVSTITTNQAAFGIQNIAVPKGAGMNVVSVSGGLNIIEYDAKMGPPVPLNLTQTPQEIFKQIENIMTDMETIMGVNSVARGNPEASLESGAALALVQSVAIQFAQGLQQSYAHLLEDVGTSVINILQEYAQTERVALIVGKANRSYLRKFKSDDLKLISRVIVDMGNPLTRTTAGRVNLAEQLIQNQLITSPQQYIEVITTGRVEPMYEGEQSELYLIRAENEKLRNGEPSPVVRTDNHDLHIQEHKSVLSSPEVRADAMIVAAALEHIAEHEQFLMPPALPPMVEDAGEPTAPSVGESMDATNMVSQQAQSVKLPQPAKVPGVIPN